MLIAIALLVMQSAPPPASSHVPVFEPPYWRSPPSAEAASQYSPGFANAIGLEGVVTLICEVERVGPPEKCDVASESPTGLGYGEAALKIAQLGVLEPRRVDGKPSRGSLTFRLPFRARPLESTNPHPYKGPPPSDLALALGQAAARSALPGFRRQMENDFYDGLAPDRIAVVRPWVEELLPIDEAKFVEELGLAFARLYAMTDMEGRLARGEGPPNLDEDALEALMRTAGSDMRSPKDMSGIRELRSRYCRTFDCEIRRSTRD